MNAVIVFHELDRISCQDKISYVVSQYVPQDMQENLNHKIALILFMILLEKYHLNIKQIMQNYNSKKYHISGKNIYFSNSYTDNCVASSISREWIGVDIETKMTESLDILHEQELGEDPTLILTRKEAYGKYLTLGLNYDYQAVNFSSKSLHFKRYGCYFDSFFSGNVIITTCSNFEKIEYVKITYLELEQFMNKFIRLLEIQ